MRVERVYVVGSHVAVVFVAEQHGGALGCGLAGERYALELGEQPRNGVLAEAVPHHLPRQEPPRVHRGRRDPRRCRDDRHVVGGGGGDQSGDRPAHRVARHRDLRRPIVAEPAHQRLALSHGRSGHGGAVRHGGHRRARLLGGLSQTVARVLEDHGADAVLDERLRPPRPAGESVLTGGGEDHHGRSVVAGADPPEPRGAGRPRELGGERALEGAVLAVDRRRDASGWIGEPGGEPRERVGRAPAGREHPRTADHRGPEPIDPMDVHGFGASAGFGPSGGVGAKRCSMPGISVSQSSTRAFWRVASGSVGGTRGAVSA